MRNVDKKALIDGNCTIPTKIIVHNDDDTTTELTQDDYILNWEHEDFRQVPNEGVIGQFVERVVNGNLKNVDDSFSIADKDIELQFAVDRSGVEPSEGITVTDAEITINDVKADETSSLTLKPSELTQETTTGKQLFNKEATVYDSGHCTYSYNNGVYTITNTDTSNFSISLNLNIPAGNYIFDSKTFLSNSTQLRNSQLSPQTQVNLGNSYSNQNITLNNSVDYIIFNFVSSNQPITLDLNTLMIRPTGTTDTYEPYSGGSPMPNPNYPSEVQVIKGNNSIKIENKNLLPKPASNGSSTGAGQGITLTYNTDNEYKLVGTALANGNAFGGDLVNNYTIKENDYLHLCNATKPTGTIQIVSRNENNSQLFAFTINSTNQVINLSNYVGKKIRNFFFYCVSGASVDMLATPMIVNNVSSAIDYIPHQEQVLPLNLPVENLLPNNISTTTLANVTITKNDDGSLTLNGTANSTEHIAVGQVSFQSGETYTISGVTGFTNSTLQLYTDSSQAFPSGNRLQCYNGPTTRTAQATESCNIRLYVYSGVNYNNVTVYPMLEKGDKVNQYTPYGTTPIEYCKIGNYSDDFIKTSGKNLFDESQLLNATGWNLNTNGYYYGPLYQYHSAFENGFTFSNSFKENTQYTLTVNAYTTAGTPVIKFEYSDGTTNNLTLSATSATDYSYTTTAGKTLSKIIGTYGSGGSNTLYIKNLQLEEGTTIGDYEPYGTNEWWLKKSIGKVVLNGNESWSRGGLGDGRYQFYITIENYKPYGDQLTKSSHFEQHIGTLDNKIYVNSSGTLLVITAPKYNNSYITERTDWQTWLSNNNVKVYSILKNPTYTKITDETLIRQLNAIYEGFKLYEGQTNISQISTSLPFNIELNYNKVINPYWYSLGNFIVNKPTDDNVKDKTNFKAVDYTKFFETKYENLLSYPTTAGCVMYSCCKQANVALGDFEVKKTTDSTIDSTKKYFTYNEEQGIYNYVSEPIVDDIGDYYELSFGFANSDFIIDANYFINNETCREVAKCIGKVAFSWVRIDWDNKCYLDYTKEDTVEEDEIDNDHYYDLTTNNVIFGELNKIVVGMKDIDGENVTIVDEQSINPDVSELDVWDNPITNTEEKRTEVIEAGKSLFGLKYQDVELTTTGHPWYTGKEKIKIKDMEDNYIYTYPFDRTISYNGHIKTKFKAEVPTMINTQYNYEGSVEKRIRNTQIQVDKANQQITSLVTETQELNDTVTEIGTVYRQTLNDFEFQVSQLNDKIDENNENVQDQINDLENKVPEEVHNALVTININGIQVSTNVSKISTLVTNDSFKIIPTNNPTEPLAFFGYDETEGRSKAEMDNLTVKNYFTAGYHRQEGYEESGEERTGWFYVGGGN